MLAGRVCNGQQRLPHIGIPVFDAIRHHRPCLGHFLDGPGRPNGQLIPKFVSLDGMNTTSKRCDLFMRRAPAHRMMTDRLNNVSGSHPSPASARAEKAEISSVKTFLPWTTHRPTTAPRR